MFTGIIECTGTVLEVRRDKTNIVFDISSPISNELKVDQSLAHNGACLTVTQVTGNVHSVTAIQETLDKTNLGTWQKGTLVNLERSMPAGGRFDGHIVQGHVDLVATCLEAKDNDGSWFFTFGYQPADNSQFTVEKGSVCINGVSLTVVNAQSTSFSVAIIPYTYEVTNFNQIQKGTQVNIEFDILGKYLQKIYTLQQAGAR